MQPRSQLLISVHDLVHRPGAMREFELELDAPEQLGEAEARVTAGTPIGIEGRLEGLHEGILVSAEVTTTAVGECVRCLDPVALSVEVEIQELFGYTEEEALDYSVRDDHVDLEPVVRDAVVLSLPFQPVCRVDCPGLDPMTGEKLAPGQEPRPSVGLDSRWAALEGFQAADHDTSGTDGAALKE